MPVDAVSEPTTAFVEDDATTLVVELAMLVEAPEVAATTLELDVVPPAPPALALPSNTTLPPHAPMAAAATKDAKPKIRKEVIRRA